MEPSPTFFRRFVESSPDGYWAFDLTGRTIYANPRACELLGRSPEEMAGLTVPDVLDGAGRRQFAAHLANALATGPNPDEVECCYLDGQGRYVPLLVSEGTLTDDDGHVVGFVHRMSRDEQRRRLLEELSHSRTLLDEAQSIARIGSWEVDVTTGATFWSRQLFHMLGLDPDVDSASATTFTDRVLEADALPFGEWLRRVEAGGGEYEIDQRVRVGGGAVVRWFRSRAVARYDDEGGLVRVGGTVQDVTDEKEVEAQLLDAVVLNALLQVMVSAANNADTVTEAFTSIREHLLGHEDWIRGVAFAVERDAEGALTLAPHLADRPAHTPDAVDWALARKVLASRGIVLDEQSRPATPSAGLLLTLDDEPLYACVLTSSSAFRRPSMVRAMLSQVVDQLRRVAERERDAAALAAARDEAMEASRLKSGFLAMMSHEIRTPLNGVIGLNELLTTTDLDPRQRRLVEGIELAGRSLLGLINDILDFSKIEAGQLELESVSFDVRATVERAVTMVTADATTKGLSLTADVAPDVPLRLLGDPTRFGQVLTNLLSNAVKFTSTGGVTVRVAVTATEPESVELTTEVVDTGIGIDPDHLQRLFEPFQQADASTTRTHGGTGLGLAISRQLVQAVGGRLGVRSGPGQGSAFWFTARFLLAGEASPPRPRTEPADAPPVRAEQPSGRVLLVEDNEINRMVALGLLESLGYTGEVAVDGAEAVAKVAQARYDAVLMDLQMPVMDGFVATQRIRAQEPPGVRVPVIALTASAITGERERCVAAGMDDFLSKPVNMDRLASVLRTHICHRRADAADEAVADEAAAASRTAKEVEMEPDARAAGQGRAGAPPPGAAAPVLETRRLDELLAMGERARPLVERAATNFITNLPGTLSDLEKAVADADSPTLRDVAHKLRGSALNLGALRVAEVTLELETLGDAARAAEARPVVTALGDAGDQTVAALAAYLAENVNG